MATKGGPFVPAARSPGGIQVDIPYSSIDDSVQGGLLTQSLLQGGQTSQVQGGASASPRAAGRGGDGASPLAAAVGRTTTVQNKGADRMISLGPIDFVSDYVDRFCLFLIAYQSHGS
jgi:hypothetical protein